MDNRVNQKNTFFYSFFVRCIILMGLLFSNYLAALPRENFGPPNPDASVFQSIPKAPPKTHGLHPLEVPILFFQKVLSPQDGPVCRFSPTCSLYGQQALRRFGAIKGILLTVDRLVRDNPYNPAGRDPLPLK